LSSDNHLVRLQWPELRPTTSTQQHGLSVKQHGPFRKARQLTVEAVECSTQGDLSPGRTVRNVCAAIRDGPDKIRAWVGRLASEHTFTIQLTEAPKIDDEHYDGLHHLEGDSPRAVWPRAGT
jgi:hypothetical protein